MSIKWQLYHVSLNKLIGSLITLARVGGGYSSQFVCVCVTTKLVFKLNYLKI